MDKKSTVKEQELTMLAQMLLIRRFEERAAQQYQRGDRIGGFCHLYIGQEAVAVGSVAATRHDDYLITAYRDHGHALARGTSPDACMAELFGKATGISKGLGGSMHYFDKENFMYGGHAIVGGHVPLAAGLAFASKYQGLDRVTLCYMGDGAINIGAFHEALNLAGLYKLPAIFICENNGFSMGTHTHRSNPLKEIVNRGKGYDMSTAVIDGMDVRKVRDDLGAIVERVRKEPQPYFVECRTYRYRGHSMSDPGSYRTKEELEKYRELDPIAKLSAQLIEEGMLTKEELEAMDNHAKQVSQASVKFAEESPEPPLEDLYKYTFVDSADPLVLNQNGSRF
jgi:pyruvate dehydrogenase E1 component alpha subunit